MTIAQAVRTPEFDAQEPAPAGPPAIEVLGADKVFSTGVRALTPIDLTVNQGEFVTLLGPSGCGKSTLLKMVANLIEPTSGGLMWWGRDYGHVGEEGKKLVFVFQDPTLMPWSRVRGNVRLPLDLAGVPKAEGNARVDRALAMVGLEKFDSSYPRQLSGGMQMRVSIARALVTEPNLLLMDEPFGALDEITRNKLDQDLLDLWFERKLTVVFVTHSIYESVFLSTRVVVMAARPGRVLREVVIDEPYPRDDAWRVSQRFAAYARDLQVLLAEASVSGAAHE
ncbi:ABC transporter ATP-binding protein [Rhodoplanes sp. TEM]|uniref:ABC transporter ATP-binding protein n=1 Tax=Rhodoplanes tepidamans TaxID=200616 RepID=A0ABT5J396_RHOTP|nr:MULTISPECIES: ABC transporter ATP-binding protein [Rhodoplanes]MDC7784141.1 ABC transporter ATP-binding protein [Rhodoplanes tepidamans]MDC7983236.1 ABC transporter ATP-binding protein [Rhodoplanes sp. TEM]MDQ0356761.1 NitT/TauT family transport system ATP-binding protein [Rhodoplanes tepidamans]